VEQILQDLFFTEQQYWLLSVW